MLLYGSEGISTKQCHWFITLKYNCTEVVIVFISYSHKWRQRWEIYLYNYSLILTSHYHDVVVETIFTSIWHIITAECFITQFDWLKLRKSYTSLPLVNHTNQGEWWCSVETILTKVNGLKRREIGHLKWLCILEWIITYFNWSETMIVYSSIIEWPY